MIDKKLRSSTSISESLYITRNADRQLADIVNDMGRPGYVLVARQMGKTNLLLNTKRENESDTRRYIYIDCSNQVGSSEEFFRHIIDTIFKTNKEIFSILRESIKENRKKATLSPSKEYEYELLALLDHYPGKIIIILDEIDALTGCDYCDTIFAQIRSTYFARINFEEFERVTYILSGVVEPSQLIKDKNKSPFNIGEKIYLNNFSYSEFFQFTKTVDLPFKNEIIAEIYDWVSGHPRMTWDVCSELEDVYLKKGHISIPDIEKTITKLYLTKFDIPPVDHIRQCLKSNTELTTAFQCFRDNKGKISDEQKTNLYLAGVISFDDESTVKINNRIIDKSLSDDWLKTVISVSDTILKRAYDFLSAKDYSNAAERLREFIEYQGSNADEETLMQVEQSLGICHYGLKAYEDAIVHFRAAMTYSVENSNEYNSNLLQVGLCYYTSENFSECKTIFEQIISSEKQNSILKMQAMFNLASTSIKLNYATSKDESQKIYEQIIENLNETGFSDIKEINELKCLAYYNLAVLSSTENNSEQAIQYYRKAIETNTTNCIPTLLWFICLLTEDLSEKKLLIFEAIDSIATNRTRVLPDRFEDTPGSLTHLQLNDSMFQNLLIAAFEFDSDKFEGEILPWAHKTVYNKYLNAMDLVTDLSIYAVSKYSLEAGELILSYFIEKIENNADVIYITKAYRTYAITLFHLDKPYINHTESFLSYYEDTQDQREELEPDDYFSFTIAIIFYRNKQKYSKLISVCDVLVKRYNVEKNDQITNYIIPFYYMAFAYKQKGIKELANKYAKLALDIIDDYGDKPTSLVDANSMTDFRDKCNRIAIQTERREPIVRKSEKIGRNDSCPCGSGQKYKKCCEKNRY